jgi:hypothetical protein
MMQERTVARPNGPQLGIPMTMRMETVRGLVRATTPEQPTMFDTLLDSQALAGMVASMISAGQAKTTADVLNDRYFLGTHRQIRVTTRFAPGYLLFDEWLSEGKVDRSGPGLAYSELPESFRQELEKKVEARLKEDSQ